MKISFPNYNYNNSFGAVKIKPALRKNTGTNTTDTFVKNTEIKEIENLLSKYKNNNGFAQIAGYNEEKGILYKYFISEIEKDKQGKEANVPNAVLFFGPKGNGKTTFSKALVKEIGAKCVSVHSGFEANSDEKFLNKLIKKANEAKELYEKTGQFSIIFLDEILSVASKESSILLELKDFVKDCYNKYHCIVLATTPDPLEIQLPITGEDSIFPYVVSVDPPNLENKQAILKHYLNDKLNVPATDRDYKMLAQMLEQKEEKTEKKYSNSTIEHRICKDYNYDNDYQNNKFSINNIIENIQNTEPDIDSEALKKYNMEFKKIMNGNTVPEVIEYKNLIKDTKPYGLDKVLGMDKLKAELVSSVIEPLTNPKYQEYDIDPVSGILLYGPPGCGKTYIIKALAEELGRYYIEIKPSDVGSIYINGTSNNIAEKFKEAKKNAPSVMFIDEIESLAPSRENLRGDDNETNKCVTELLTNFNEAKNNGIFIICASNEPQKIDKAIKRSGRLDKKIYVPQPDVDTRKAFIKDKLSRIKAEGVDVDVDLIAQNTEYFTAEDIKNLMQTASINAINDGIPLNTEHLLNAIKEYKPDLNEYIVERYKLKGDI